MSMLVAGLIVFLGVHLVPTVPALRTSLVDRWGDRPYRGIVSLASLVGILLIVWGYGRAPRGEQLFPPSSLAIAIAPYAVTLALVLFAAANMRGHTRRIVKHPMLLGLAIWAAVHLAANGDTRGTVLFASFLAYAAVDFASALQRHAVRSFDVAPRHDLIGVVAGIVVALALMALHRVLFGVRVVPWGW
jgi:uncharacterized membrane protein